MFTATLNRSHVLYKGNYWRRIHFKMAATRTHDWNKFIKPEEFKNLLSKVNFSTLDIKVLSLKPLKKWMVSNDLSVNYIINSLKV